jgi:hypothetical protein
MYPTDFLRDQIEQLVGAQISSAWVDNGLHLQFVDGRSLVLEGEFMVSMCRTEVLH